MMYLILGFVLFLRASSLSLPHIPKGNETEPHSHPWMLSLHYGNVHYCGASLLRVPCMEKASNIALTAAHCLRKGKSGATIKAGEHNIKKPESGEQTRKIEKFVIHQPYNYPIYDNDIAVIQLDNAIKFSPTIQPINLPPVNDRQAPNTVYTFAGWGRKLMTSPFDWEYPDELQELDVVENRSVCVTEHFKNQLSRKYKYNNDIMMCIVRRFGGVTSSTTCFADSGGPLIREQVVGAVQYGVLTGGPVSCDTAAVFARVSTYAKWIESQIDRFSKCDP